MTNLSIVHILLLSTFLLATFCDARQSRILRVSDGVPRRVPFGGDWRKAEDSRLLKAATDDATAQKGGDDKTADEDSDDDDGSVLIADDAVANKTALIPREPEQPSTWPATVLVIFLVLSAVLLGKTAYTNLRKRSHYQEVPTTNLTV
jgi:hypothetical protein